MGKITINMLSQADSVKGQGVGSAYQEQVKLVSKCRDFNILVNDFNTKETDIYHHHTINFKHYIKLGDKKATHIAYVHFLPETLDGSIKLNPLFFKAFKKYIIDFYRKADYLVVVNPIFINMLAHYKIPKDRIKYIPNVVSRDKFHVISDNDKKAIREKYNIKEDEFVVIGVGQIQNRKGVKDFVEVAKALKEVKFIWCGGFSFGNITDGYKELKEIYDNPPSNVLFPGIVDRNEMNGIYNMADLLFMPSYNELFPMSILEACNTHLPLLLRNLELYEDILFKKYMIGENNEEFIENIKKLKEDKRLYNKYKEYSFEISEYYKEEHVLKLWVEYYKEIYNKNIKEEVK